MVTAIITYASTEVAPEAEKDTFYYDLTNTLQHESPYTIVIVLGDLNAQIGNDSHEDNSQVVGRYNYHLVTNGNGHRLVNLCHQTQLRHVQSRFPHLSKRQ